MSDVNAPHLGCFICGDPRDHDGRPHSEATGDTTTRYDLDGPAVPMPEEPEVSDKVLLVLTCEGEHFDRMSKLVNGALMSHYEATGVQLNGPSYAATGPDYEMVLDVFRPAESGGGLHHAKVDDDGWALEHSLRCRKAGLLNCPLTRHVDAAFRNGELDLGTFRVWWDDEYGILQWEEQS